VYCLLFDYAYNCSCSEFLPRKQQDAHELFVKLVHNVHEEESQRLRNAIYAGLRCDPDAPLETLDEDKRDRVKGVYYT
jgi:hypothetical protein